MMPVAFKNLGTETITATSHLEKVGLFKQGVGKDNISDFTTNLILDYLLKYTENFTLQHIDSPLCKKLSIKKAYFDYGVERWVPRNYTLPYFQGDFIILTPKDILTRDETWINQHEMLDRFDEISASIDNAELRALIDNYFRSRIPTTTKAKDSDKVIKYARWETIKKYPELIE